jgi:hypothetical protein
VVLQQHKSTRLTPFLTWRSHSNKFVLRLDSSTRPTPSNTLIESTDSRQPTAKMVLTEYTYVFAIGTMFALLEAYNNGASTS